MTHFNDLIDSAIFIKENELAPKIALYGSNPSGSLTALTSVFKEPFLFEGVAVHVSLSVSQPRDHSLAPGRTPCATWSLI